MGLLEFIDNPRPDPLRDKRRKAALAVLQGWKDDAGRSISDFGDSARGLLAPTTGTAIEGFTRAFPVTGEAWAVNDAGNELAKGNYGQAALGAGIGLLPFGGLLLGSMKNAGKETLEQITRTVATPKEVKQAAKFLSGDKAKTYRGTGAFGDINSQQLGVMRKNYLARMREGVDGRRWYDESSADISRWTGGNTRDADAMANALAVTSAGTGVAPNLQAGNKGWNQFLVGDPVRTGRFPVNMGSDIEAAFLDPAASASGLKRSPFSAGLSVDWRGADFANRATHDIHDVRAWGITLPNGEPWNKGVSDAGHRFLDEQSKFVTDRANALNLGGADDWTQYRAQAAAWIAQKAKNEGKPISETAKHYGSFAPEYQALLPREWIPGDNTGHLRGLLGASPEVRSEVSDALERHVTGPQGIDSLARGMGALVDTTLPNKGFYEGATNPGYMSLLNVGKGSETGIDDASRRVVEAVQGAHGLLGLQKQQAWNFGTSRASTGHPINDMDVMQFRGSFDAAQRAKLHGQIESMGGVPMTDPYGVRGLFFDPSTNKANAKTGNALASAMGGNVRFLKNSGDIFPPQTPTQWSSKPFIEKIEGGGSRMIDGFDSQMKTLAPQLLSTTEALAAKHGWNTAPYYRPMMEALSTGGLAKLKELVAKGIVPAAAFATIAGAVMGENRGAYE